jgi:hypothetical protein
MEDLQGKEAGGNEQVQKLSKQAADLEGKL